MASYEDLRSDKALVCKREINNDQGGPTVWMVLLSDGHLLDCGSRSLAERRAIVLATMINEAGAERLSLKALAKRDAPDDRLDDRTNADYPEGD